MSKQKKPLLTIGMIFRDDIRSLERCLKALQPLRDTIPCELIMADTGSIDGSREVAVRYADVLFDFPWVDDFSAARNAVMDRCTGEWYLSIDADEWLDGDITELVEFLRRNEKKTLVAAVLVRNYNTAELERGSYFDGKLVRLLRMSTGVRYAGAIHESWGVGVELAKSMPVLQRTMLHHDGYAKLNEAIGLAKQKRNRAIIRSELEKQPNDLRLLMSYIDCSRFEADCLDYIRRAADLVEAKASAWDLFGPPILRHAVFHAERTDMPELEAWAARSLEWFPDSFFTRVDVSYIMFQHCWQERDYAGCVRWGEAYLAACQDLEHGRGDQTGLLYGILLMHSPAWRNNCRLLIASANMKAGYPARALELLEETDGSALEPAQAGNLAVLLREFQSETSGDTANMVSRLYDEVCAPVPTEEAGQERRRAFLNRGAVAFDPAAQKKERQEVFFCRLSYTLFAPLADRCELGVAAAMLETRDCAELENLLRAVERWEELPAIALEHAIQQGVEFPMADRTLKLEEMDALAAGMIHEDSSLTELAIQAVERTSNSYQSLIWARELTLAAVQSCDWTDSTQGERLCRAFAAVSGRTLPRYYGAEILNEETIDLLPPMHRFGWYCAQAFEVLDSGDSAEYVRLLRAGLVSCPDRKDMVEVLLQNLQQVHQATVPPELLALAEQVRTILSAYDPNDPAVTALKASPAYQKVAYLIEGTDGGGLPS